jgi:putative copper resistance protein D
MIDVGLVLSRLLHYAATMTLAGLSFFPLYAHPKSEPAALNRWRGRALLSCAVAALLGGLLWLVFAAANMSGSLADLADPEVIGSLVRETGFGAVWTARMALAVIIVVIAAIRISSTVAVRRDLITPLLAAILLGSLAGTGHSQIETGWTGAIHVGSDAAHLVAAGAWLGGLAALGFILTARVTTGQEAEAIDIDRILLRFSGMGYVAVATIVASGLTNSWFLVGSFSNLLNTPYGQILLVKLALFAMMVGLAAANRFRLVASMSRTVTAASGASAVRFRNRVRGEQLLGLTILLAVSVLGTIRPAVGQ